MSKEGYLVLDADKLAEMFERSVSKLEKLVEDEKIAEILIQRYEKKQGENYKFQVLPSPFFTVPIWLQSVASVVMEDINDFKKLEK